MTGPWRRGNAVGPETTEGIPRPHHNDLLPLSSVMSHPRAWSGRAPAPHPSTTREAPSDTPPSPGTPHCQGLNPWPPPNPHPLPPDTSEYLLLVSIPPVTCRNCPLLCPHVTLIPTSTFCLPFTVGDLSLRSPGAREASRQGEEGSNELTYKTQQELAQSRYQLASSSSLHPRRRWCHYRRVRSF